ncbi:MAG: hypothetical protein QM780_01930 [Hyphomicrobium sp.]|uniref:hypothetical protein n=1 Tax=Hyphomicrobium sp. TaxID=82 RepID=UPI0039E6BBE8
MTAFSRPLTIISAVAASLIAASAASALPAAKPGVSAGSTRVLKVNDRYDRGDYRYRHHYDHRHVVHAPFTRVESGHRTVVDAPFVHVYDGRHGTHVVAPFVDLWR